MGGRTTITVGIPAYNAGRWIDETIDSVLAQTRPADQIIVVDDGSTDDTAERARSHGDRVTVVEQANGGPSAAYNRAFDMAAGQYVAMCPADDLWEPRKLEWQAETLEADPSIDVSFGRAVYFGLSDGEHPHPLVPGRQDAEAFLRTMYMEDLIATPTTLVRRELHQRLGRFDESLHCEDYEFWLRALSAGAVFHYDARLMVNLRQHGGNVSAQALGIWEMNHKLRDAYAERVGDPDLSRRLMARDLREIARCRFGAGRPIDAGLAYAASLRKKPSAEALVGAVVLRAHSSARFLSAINQRRRARSRA